MIANLVILLKDAQILVFDLVVQFSYDIMSRLVTSIHLCFEVHARRLQSLKALTYAPETNSEILSRLYEIVFGILEKVWAFLLSLLCTMLFFSHLFLIILVATSI